MSRGLFVTGLLAASGLVLACERLTYRVELEVAYADRRGPESIREAIQVAALEALRQRGCFMELEGEAPVLRARVLLAGLRERASRPGSPSKHDRALQIPPWPKWPGWRSAYKSS